MKRTLVAVFVVVLAGGAVAGYRWTTRSTPVTLEEAVEKFRAAAEAGTTGTAADGEPTPLNAKAVTRELNEVNRKFRDASGRRWGQAARGVARTTERVKQSSESAPLHDTNVMAMPLEGVYTYATSGWEGFLEWKRDFPKESRRVVTYEDDNSWNEHHMFSDERQTWSGFTMTSANRLVPYQRNLIKIGPYTKDEKVVFEPPAVTAVFPLRVGRQWTGEFTGEVSDGEYSGEYRGRILARKRMTVGGTPVLVWGVNMHFVFRGALDGTVEFDRWISAAYGLNVHENYTADVKIGPLMYHGEWSMRLNSLIPHR